MNACVVCVHTSNVMQNFIDLYIFLLFTIYNEILKQDYQQKNVLEKGKQEKISKRRNKKIDKWQTIHGKNPVVNNRKTINSM